MQRYAQKELVRDLVRCITDDICNKIVAGTIPKEWDGHELRCLLAEKFKDAAQGTEIQRRPNCGRARDYRNTVRVNNL